eukprot:3937604-Rhodomonas_salina.2
MQYHTVKQNIEDLPHQTGQLPFNVLSGMLASTSYRNYTHLERGRQDEHFFQVSVRNLNYPEKLVMKNRALLNLDKWYLHFQNDIFQDVMESSAWKFPVLEKSDRFYTVKFTGPNKQLFEVSVCPVFDANGIKADGDLVNVFVIPPEFAPTYKQKLT